VGNLKSQEMSVILQVICSYKLSGITVYVKRSDDDILGIMRICSLSWLVRRGCHIDGSNERLCAWFKIRIEDTF
jgi:hypothetical protein